VLNPGASAHANRVARPARVPAIFEEDEAGSDALAEDGSQSPTPVMRRKKSLSSSSSHAPAHAPTVSPPTLPSPIVATIQVDINESLLKQGKKRISRRQSGLINVTSSSGSVSSSSASSSSKGRGASPLLRPPSPAFGSPLRRDAALAEGEDEYEAILGQRSTNAKEEPYLERAASKGKKLRTLTHVQADELVVEDDREREKRRLRDDPEIVGQRLQDVTNAFGSRVSLPPLDTNVLDQDHHRTPSNTDSDIPSSALTSSTRPLLSTPGTTPAPSHLPTPRNSSPPPIPIPPAEPDSSTVGRERRVRKSVNYAEPKLNTKMRKPDSAPLLLKRAHCGSQPLLGENPRPSPEDPITVTERRRKSRPRPPVDDDESDGAQADDEPLAGTSVRVGLSNFDMRRRSAVVSSSRRSFIEDDEGRRHSMLV